VSEQRLQELESRQAFQDDTIAALNDALYQQQRRIERLELQLGALARRLDDVRGRLPPEEEAPPPHY